MRTLGESEASDTSTTTNTKHNLTPSQISINTHTENLLISVPVPQYNLSDVQQKIKRHAKNGGKKLSEDTQPSLEPQSNLTWMLI